MNRMTILRPKLVILLLATALVGCSPDVQGPPELTTRDRSSARSTSLRTTWEPDSRPSMP